MSGCSVPVQSPCHGAQQAQRIEVSDLGLRRFSLAAEYRVQRIENLNNPIIEETGESLESRDYVHLRMRIVSYSRI